MITLRKEVHENTMIPKYYGLAWDEPWRDVAIAYPIPINFVMGWGYCFMIILKHGPLRLVAKIKQWFC